MLLSLFQWPHVPPELLGATGAGGGGAFGQCPVALFQ